MPGGYVYVSTAVPTDRLREFHVAVSRLLEGPTAPAPSGVSAPVIVDDEEGEGSDRDMTELVYEAYYGGDSRVQRPFLHLLASRPDEWVGSDEVMAEIDRTPVQYRGAMGAFERRLGAENLPYEKRWNQNKRWYRMSSAIADMVNELRADEERNDA